MTFASIKNAINFYLPYVDDSIDFMEVELSVMRWRSYWLRHEDNSLPYNNLDVLLSAKEMHTYHLWKFLLKIDNWLGYYSNK